MRDQNGLKEEKTNSQRTADFNIAGYREGRMISDVNENKKTAAKAPWMRGEQKGISLIR